MSPLDKSIHTLDCIGADLGATVSEALEHCTVPADYARLEDQLCVIAHDLANRRQVVLGKGSLARPYATEIDTTGGS